MQGVSYTLSVQKLSQQKQIFTQKDHQQLEKQHFQFQHCKKVRLILVQPYLYQLG